LARAKRPSHHADAALVNDLFMRLHQPLDTVRIRLGRKTADHGLGDEIQEQVLITTPESVESLLTFRRASLEQIQAVILDEIHLLDGSPRGDQLRCLLGRLTAFRHHIGGPAFGGLQLIAMSATVSDPRRLADVYLGTSSEIVAVPGQRELEAHIVLAGGTDQQRAEAAIQAVDNFPDVHKLLVFVNSRKQVDTAAGHFRVGRFSHTPVYGHHGSLSKAQREEVEARFKVDYEAICVATMTLEVGIDIGDIDLIVCIDPPFSLASFLQRIGRGCRRLNGRTRVLCVSRDRAGELMFQALVRQAALCMPPGPIVPFRRSVLFQQVLAYLKQVPKNLRVVDQFVRVLVSASTPVVTEQHVQDVLSDMVQNGFLDKKGDVYQPASDGWTFIESNRIYSNIQPSPLEVTLVDVESGEIVATVAGIRDDASGIRVAGRSYELVGGGSPFTRRVREGGDHVDSPRYFARSLPYAFDIGACLANHFGIHPNELFVLRVGKSVIVMTWLGNLLNAVLGSGLRKRGINATEGSFRVTLELEDESGLIPLLREVIQEAIRENPLANLRTERMADLGPHHRHLSPTLQAKASEDWFDSDFLRAWGEALSELRLVPADSEQAASLVALI